MRVIRRLPPFSLVVALGPLAIFACSSSNSAAPPQSTPIADSGPSPVTEAGVDAAPAPVPEPPWSGQTVEPGCTANGCIHAFTQKETFAQSELQLAAASGTTVNNGLIEYTITYVSDGAEITGSIFYPDNSPPSGGWGVVVMNQFTSGVAPACAPSAGTLAVGVASATAINGFVTIVPDATSYGPAPYSAYLEGPVAGHAALNAARAAFHTTQATGYSIARKAVIAGLSQGAYSTMAAATAYPSYANELEIRGFVAAEPPSDLSQTMASDFARDTGNFVYDALRLWSWQGGLKLSGGSIFVPPYDTLAPSWFESACIFEGATGASGNLYGDFYEPVPSVSAAAVADDGGSDASSGDAGVADAGSGDAGAGGGSDASTDGGADAGPVPVPAASIFTPTFINYAQNQAWPSDWAAAYAASNTIPSYLSLPVLIFEGTSDTTVYPSDVDTYVAQLKAAGVNVDYRQIPGGTHDTTALSSFTVTQLANDQAVAWIQSTLAN